MSVEIYKKSEKRISLPGLNEEQQSRLESAKRYCQEQSVRFEFVKLSFKNFFADL